MFQQRRRADVPCICLSKSSIVNFSLFSFILLFFSFLFSFFFFFYKFLFSFNSYIYNIHVSFLGSQNATCTPCPGDSTISDFSSGSPPSISCMKLCTRSKR